MTNELSQQGGRQKLIIGGLLLLVTAVVFMLPTLVSESLILEADKTSTPIRPETIVSPSKVAEKTKYREDSQRVLAQIISVRDSLKQQNVEYWGDFEFRQALVLVDQGDDQYGYGDYRDALASYQGSLEQLQALEKSGKIIFEEALLQGNSAVENAKPADIARATEAAATAIAIAPEDARAQQLNQRAAQLERLIAALDYGQQRLATDELAAAKAYFQQAVAVDGLHAKAAAALASVEKAITEQRFRGHMSDGFAGLDNNQFVTATNAFKRAGEIYRNHPAVAQALSQVATKESQISVSRQMQQAAEFESREQWQQALDTYQTLLRTDSSLVEAKVKIIIVTVRASLDSQLKAVLVDPLKLSDSNQYNSAQRMLQDAAGIANPGPVLNQQIADLKTVLQQSTTAVDVVLQSNNRTEVTLYRVAKLGAFEQTSLQLKPGRYIAAGTRMGYRDVRVEFTITGAPIDGPIRVSCDEMI